MTISPQSLSVNSTSCLLDSSSWKTRELSRYLLLFLLPPPNLASLIQLPSPVNDMNFTTSCLNVALNSLVNPPGSSQNPPRFIISVPTLQIKLTPGSNPFYPKLKTPISLIPRNSCPSMPSQPP